MDAPTEKRLLELLEEIPILRKEVARLNLLLEELEQALESDEGLTLKPQVVEELRRSLARPRNEFISLDEARRRAEG